MRIAAVVPYRGRDAAKTRLQPPLSDEARQSLSDRLLRHVVDVLNNCPQIEAVRVISPQTIEGYEIIRDGGDGLNEAVLLGCAWTKHEKINAVLVIAPD